MDLNEPIGDPTAPVTLPTTLTPASVPSTPVQAPATLPTTPTSPSVTPVTPMTTPADPNAEARVRHFQAEADKARREADEAKAQLQQLSGNQKAIIDGSAQAVQQMGDELRQLKANMERETAARLKAEALMQHPELKEYAGFIPATTDPTQLASYIQTFADARAKDLANHEQTFKAQLAAAAPAATPAAPAAPQSSAMNALSNLYGQLTPTPAMNPATPSPSASGTGQTTPEAIHAALVNAMAMADAEPDTLKRNALFQAELNRQGAIASAHIQSQIGR